MSRTSLGVLVNDNREACVEVAVLMEEIDHLGELMIAASATEKNLTSQALDRIFATRLET